MELCRQRVLDTRPEVDIENAVIVTRAFQKTDGALRDCGVYIDRKCVRGWGELLKMAEVCGWVPEHPARTFHEALQSMFFLHTCVYMEHESASYNPGCFDQYMYLFYKADLGAGRITPDEAQELLNCLWVKFSEPCLFQDATTARYSAGYPMFQNLCVGGVDQNGMDAVNDLSYMVLQATMEVQMF